MSPFHFHAFQEACPACNQWVTVQPVDRRPEHGCPMEVWDQERRPPLIQFPRPVSKAEGDA